MCAQYVCLLQLLSVNTAVCSISDEVNCIMEGGCVVPCDHFSAVFIYHIYRTTKESRLDYRNQQMQMTERHLRQSVCAVVVFYCQNDNN